MKKLLPLLVIIPVVLGFKGSGFAYPFTFTKIAETKGATGSPVGEFSGSPSINNSGMVAFVAQEGIFVGSGGALTSIAPNSPSSYTAGTVDINSAGEVAFQRNYSGVFKGSGGPVTTIVDTSGSFNNFGGHPTINDAGVVAFSGYGANRGIFTGNGGGLTTIVDTNGPFWGVAGPSINSSGLVTFKGFLDEGGEGIYTGSGGTLTTIASTIGPFFTDLYGSPDINDHGIVAFSAMLDGGLQGIFTGDGSTVTTIADTFWAIDSNPSINNSGMVAFKARPEVGQEAGIYIGPDPIFDKVIGTGDLLDGSTVTSILSFHDGLNDQGQIAFSASLADGRDIIVRADPGVAPVPEPATILLVGIGLGGIYGLRRRRHRST